MAQNKGFIIDMDGTIYRGSQLIDGAAEFIDFLQRNNIRNVMLTNCPYNSPASLHDKMKKMGISIPEKLFLTSGMAAASYVKGTLQMQKVYIIGSVALEEIFTNRGFVLTDKNPEAVIVGYDRNFTYEKMCKAVKLIHDTKAAFIATNRDNVVPDGNSIAPHTGAIAESIAVASGVEPIYLGKPHRMIVEEAARLMSCPLNSCCIIGDRLDTDIAAGINSGIDSFLVLSGCTTRKEAEASNISPTKIFNHVGEIIHTL